MLSDAHEAARASPPDKQLPDRVKDEQRYYG
jgi:hypothetical protein